MRRMYRALLPLVCLALGSLGCRRSSTTALEQIVQRQLPVGTTAEETEKVLGKYKVEHSFAAKDNAYYAIIRDIGRGDAITTDNVTLIIYLDDAKRVRRVKVSKVLTGP